MQKPGVIASPDGQVFVNATGNPGVSSAGNGDVLAGLCAGLLAQGLSPLQAAVAAVHIGGAAADCYAHSRDPRTLLASDLINLLPELLKERFPETGIEWADKIAHLGSFFLLGWLWMWALNGPQIFMMHFLISWDWYSVFYFIEW